MSAARISLQILLLFFYFAPGMPLCQTVNGPNSQNKQEALTKVADVRALSQYLAAHAVPVRVTGVVTTLSGYRNSFFVQDASAGISVDRTDTANVSLGDRVEVVGVSNAGLFAPVIMASKVTVLGRAPLPIARPVTYADLIGGAEDSQRIEVSGVVHSAKVRPLFGRDTLYVGLDVGGADVNIKLQDFSGMDYSHLIDSTVRVRGVCSTDFNHNRQFVGAAMFVPLSSDFVIKEWASIDPFKAPTQPIQSALRFGQAAHRVKVSGVVTWQIPGHLMYIQNENDGIRIESSLETPMAIGSEVEVVGFPAMGAYSPVLKEGLFRYTGNASAVTPLSIDAKRVIVRNGEFVQANYDGQLVQIQGRVIESRSEGADTVLLLRQESELYEAHLPHSQGHALNLDNGTIVRLTGICAIVADLDRNPVNFTVLLRSEKDIVIVKKAPWWNPANALALFAALSIGTTVVAMWVVSLRSRVEQQTRLIRESESRYRDLAEHDVLTGLLNRLMLEDRMTQALDKAKGGQLLAAVLTVDIDHFKRINDTHGHLVGDEVLKSVAARLRRIVRSTDTIARTGGEEFTVVVGALKSVTDAKRVASNIIELFQQPIALVDLTIQVTVSVGCAMFPDDGTATDELRRLSDEALYAAKETGRNRFVFVSELEVGQAVHSQ